MMKVMRLLPAVAVCAGLTLPGCMSASRPAPPAFLAMLPQDAVALQSLIREQERHVQLCAAERACPRARYMRGLAALYEDRAVARAHFQAVLAAEPNGPYAVSSRYWIQLLGEDRSESAREAKLVHAMERVVRQVLEDEAVIREASRGTREAKSSAAALKESQAVQALKQQLKEREREIDVLTEQIDALKRVDQEVREQVKPGRPVN